LGEIEPGIPLKMLLDGAYYGMPVITKGGAFGGVNTPCCSVKLLGGPL
jgi:uncharacterized protein YgbK (DUF1537 family)